MKRRRRRRRIKKTKWRNLDRFGQAHTQIRNPSMEPRGRKKSQKKKWKHRLRWPSSTKRAQLEMERRKIQTKIQRIVFCSFVCLFVRSCCFSKVWCVTPRGTQWMHLSAGKSGFYRTDETAHGTKLPVLGLGGS